MTKRKTQQDTTRGKRGVNDATGLDLASQMLALEPRILFDGAAVATGLDTSGDLHQQINEQAIQQEQAHEALLSALTGEEVSQAQASGDASRIVFIDAAVEDRESLIAGIDPGFDIYLIDASRDGVEQIAEVMATRSNVEQLHIISHGRSGTLELGSTKLTEASMVSRHADELAVIANALSGTADILIYGCDFASGARGRDAVAALSTITGADVAASDDLTGAAALGGDWELEVRSGEIEALAISPLAWAGTLDLTITNIGTGGVSVAGPAVDALAQQMLGDGVTINAASYSGGPNQAATFVTGPGASFGSNILTFDDGVIFSTGTAVSVAGPNSAGGFTVNAPGIDGDPDFNALAGNSTFDASFLEVTFTPDVPAGASPGDTGRMTMEIVFGSDEYNEYVYGGVNDTLAVIVNGVNQAVVPNGLAIGIDTINDAATYNPAFGSPTLDPNPEHTSAGFESANPSLYVNNVTGTFNTQMDGFTITIPVTFDVIVGQQNTIKIGIADTGDSSWDSWMFVKADSAQTVIVAESDSVSTPTNIPFNIDVTANDYDLQGDTLTVTHILDQAVSPGDTVTLASGVDVTVEPDGSLTVAGDGVNTANDAFTYSITDGNGGTSTAFVNVAITAAVANSPPAGVNDIILVIEDVTSGPFDVLGNDTDPDNDPLTISSAQIDTNGDGTPDALTLGLATPLTDNLGDPIGTITVEANGNVTFDPAPDYTGPVPVLTYTPNDGTVDGTPATVTFGPITPVNDAPVGVDDNIGVIEDTPVTQNVLGNDADADGDPLTITAAEIDTDGDGNPDPLVLGTPTPITDNLGNPIGTITVAANGDVIFDPAPDYTGPVPVLTYTPNDGTVDGTPATVTFGPIVPVNDPPVLNLDPNNDSGTPGDPSDDGADDGGFEVTFTENAPAVAIVDADVTVSDPEDDIVEVVVTLTNGLTGDTINFPSVLPGNVTAAVSPASTLVANGVMTLTLTGDASTTSADWETILQALSFEPNTNDIHNPDPADRNITFEAFDSSFNSSGTLATVVHVVPVNDPPTLDLDDDNSSGLNAGNYQGTYIENDPGAAISSGLVITDLDDTNLEGMTITLTNGEAGDILNIATLPAGISLVGAAPADLTAAGTITVQLTGTASLSDYQDAIAAITFANTTENPVAGIREITVAGTDGEDATPTRTAFITVQPVNDAPIPHDPLNPGVPADAMPPQAGSDAVALTPFDAAPYFFDPDNTPAELTLALDPATTPAWMSLDSNGNIVGTPPGDASQNTNVVGGTPGSYEITVTATDPDGLTASTTVSYTIANQPPVAVNDTFMVFENAAGLTGNVHAANPLTADSDPDNDGFSVSLVNGAAGNVGVSVAGDNGGQFVITSGGGFSFSQGTAFDYLADGEVATTSVTYTIDDGQGGTSQATVSVTVVGVNDTPVVDTPIADQIGDDAGLVAGIDVSGNFTDPDASNALSFTAAGLPAGLTMNSAGIISGAIDPSASQNGNTGTPTDGVYTVVVTATDDEGATITDTFTYTVGNPPPVAVDDSYGSGDGIDEDTAVTGLNVVTGPGADSDPDGDSPLIISQVGGSAGNVGVATAGTNGGLFTIQPDGTLDFDPNGDFESLAAGESASTTVTYELSDGEGGVDTATVTIVVAGVNDNPVPVVPGDPNPPADPNAYIAVQPGTDNALATPLDVTQFVEDPDTSDSLTFAINPADLPPGLTFDGTTISGTFDPSASQGGPNSDGIYPITLTVTDGNGGIFTTTITYDVGNPPPVAEDDNLTAPEDGTSTGNVFADNGNGIDDDPDGDTFTVTAADQGGTPVTIGAPFTTAGGGVLTLNDDGSYTFDPGTAYNGLDDGETAVETISYTITDADGATDTATVTLTVQGANDAPVPVDPNNPGTPDNPIPADPNTVIPVQAADDGEDFTTTPLIDVSDYVVDPDGEPLTFTTSDPLPPGLTLNPDGTVTGTVDPDASQGGPNNDGLYPVTVTIDDGTTTSTIQLTIDVSNPPPVAQDDAATGDEDSVVTGNVITDPVTGDADTAPDSDPVTVTDVDGTPVAPGTPAVLSLTNGTLTMNDDGSWDFAPNGTANTLGDGETAIETVTYTIDDGNGGTDTATLEITITGVNDPVQVVDPNDPTTDPQNPLYDPVNPAVIADPDNLIPDVIANDGDTPADIPAGGYFGDAEGDPLTFSATGLPPGLSIDPATGTISGTLDPDASQGGNTGTPGEYLVTITAEDPQGNTATTTVTYTVSNLPPAPVADAETTDEDTDVTGNVLDNDADTPPDSDSLSVSEAGGQPIPDGGTVTIPLTYGELVMGDDGSWTFTPNNLANSLDTGESVVETISYTADDGNGGLVAADLVITINGVNDVPDIIDPANPGDPNDPTPADPGSIIPVQVINDADDFSGTPLIDVSIHALDPEGDALTFATSSPLPPGLTLNPDGTITGVVDNSASTGGPNGDGIYEIEVIIDDGEGQSTVTLVIDVDNPPPIVVDPLPDGEEYMGEDVTIPTAQAFDDPDGDDLTFSATGLPPGLAIDPVTGEISGTLPPSSQFAGDYTVTVTADDGDGGTVSSTFVFTVLPRFPAEQPAPPPDLPGPTGPLGPDDAGAAELVITSTVNDIAPLGGSTLLDGGDSPLTTAINGVYQLGNSPDFDPTRGQYIREVVRWINGSSNPVWMDSLRNSLDASPYTGDHRDFSFGAEGDVRVRTLVLQGAVFIDFTAGNTVDGSISVSLPGGQNQSWFVSHVRNGLVISHIPAGTEWLELSMSIDNDSVAGEEWRFLVNTLSGEVMANERVERQSDATPFSTQLQKLAQQRSKADALLLEALRG